MVVYPNVTLFRIKTILCVAIVAASASVSTNAFVVNTKTRGVSATGGYAPLHSTVLEAAPSQTSKPSPKKQNPKKRRRTGGKNKGASGNQKRSVKQNKKKGSSTKKRSEYKGNRKQKNSQVMMRKWKSKSFREKQLKADENSASNGVELVSAVGLKAGNQSRHNGTNKRNKGRQSGSKPQNVRKPQRTTTTTKDKQGKNMLSWMDLSPGSKVSGDVIKVLPYGALVKTPYDIPGRTHGCAMLHISQLANEKIEDISEYVKVGQHIDNARVVSLNRDEGRVAISLRNQTQRAIPLETLKVGDEVEGKVVRMKQYGVFVDIGCKRNALLHISRVSLYKVENIADHVNVGDTVKVRVLRLDSDEKNIAVSMLTAENDKFVDRRDLQRKRVNLWQKIVNSQDDDMDDAKRELLELDKVIWDDFFDSLNTPRSVEV